MIHITSENNSINAIMVSDISGRKLMQQNIAAAQEYQLPVDLTPGIYLVTVATANGNYTTQLFL